MRQAVALCRDGDGGRGASRDGVAHHAGQRSLDSMGESERNRGERVERGDEATGLDDLRGGASRNGVAHHAGLRGLDGVGASDGRQLRRR
jgi:hypothetical protein